MNDLRAWMRLIENHLRETDDDDDRDDYGDDEEDDSRFDHLPPAAAIKAHLAKICAAAQNVYDRWDQSDPDDDELAGGGICHLIADQIVNVLDNAGMSVTTVSSMHEVHVYCVGQFRDGVIEIDIPYGYYERGGGYTWQKIPNVHFTPDMVHIELLDHDPARIDQYVEEWSSE
jgi:hypothetical protein